MTFQPSQPVLWVHTPSRTGNDYVFAATVREVLPGGQGYLIDTENQKGVKVGERDLRENQSPHSGSVDNFPTSEISL
jgi:hypothetical protein